MNQLSLSDLPRGAHIHFIGIGGISMSGLAQVMLGRGFRVTGSDRMKTHITDKLEKLGATVFEGHSADNVKGADIVVYTAAETIRRYSSVLRTISVLSTARNVLERSCWSTLMQSALQARTAKRQQPQCLRTRFWAVDLTQL